MSQTEKTPNNVEKPTEKPIRDIVTGPEFVYIENSDQRPINIRFEIPNNKE